MEVEGFFRVLSIGERYFFKEKNRLIIYFLMEVCFFRFILVIEFYKEINVYRVG